MAAAVVAAMVLTFLQPDAVRAGPNWLLPAIEGALLVAIIARDPGKIDVRSDKLRLLSLGLVAVLVFGALWATGQLVDDLIHGSPTTNSANDLLEAGSVVWLSTIIAFGLLFWELDAGGSAARAQGVASHPDFAFPQQNDPALARPGWRPHFVDYLYLAFTNAMAFSPTDAMPLAPWAKMAMALQAMVSLAILGLVVARAVNVFT